MLVVPAASEEQVDAILDEIDENALADDDEGDALLPDEEGEDGGEEAATAMSDLFIAADALQQLQRCSMQPNPRIAVGQQALNRVATCTQVLSFVVPVFISTSGCRLQLAVLRCGPGSPRFERDLFQFIVECIHVSSITLGAPACDKEPCMTCREIQARTACDVTQNSRFSSARNKIVFIVVSACDRICDTTPSQKRRKFLLVLSASSPCVCLARSTHTTRRAEARTGCITPTRPLRFRTTNRTALTKTWQRCCLPLCVNDPIAAAISVTSGGTKVCWKKPMPRRFRAPTDYNWTAHGSNTSPAAAVHGSVACRIRTGWYWSGLAGVLSGTPGG